MSPSPSTKPTVCQVLHGLQVGGAEILAARLARGLCGTYRFVFACLDELGTLGATLRDEGFTVEVLGRRPGVDWRCSRHLRAFLRRERADLVHAHQYAPFFYATMARMPGGQSPVLMTEHGRTFPDYPRPKRMLANRFLLARRDRVVGVGQAVRAALIANEGMPARRIEVIYNGIDLPSYTDSPRQREYVRRELGLGPDDLAIFQVARLDPLKDHATAIRAMTLLAGRHPAARLFLIGEGPEESAIRELARRNGLDQHVRFLGLRSDVPWLLPAADICLLTSVSEGIPLVLIEAMAASLPVVATGVGGVPEVVEGGRTGFISPSADHSSLAGSILTLAASPELRESMGRAGRERAAALFSERQMHRDYLKIYANMIEK
jgi:glycosyltransferase involved in cell wall biosynthesis